MITEKELHKGHYFLKVLYRENILFPRSPTSLFDKSLSASTIHFVEPQKNLSNFPLNLPRHNCGDIYNNDLCHSQVLSQDI